LAQVIGLGTQDFPYGASPKVTLGFETDKRMEDGKPYFVSRWFTLSLLKKSSLRGFLESWLSRGVTVDGRCNFSFDAFLEMPALLSVMHKADAQGESKARINSISPLPDGLEAPPMVNAQIVFDLANADPMVFAAIPQGLQDIIKKYPSSQRLD
jgi:hypothetical protein